MPDELIDLQEARRAVTAAASPLGDEPVALEHALGRVLAEDVAADRDQPPFDSSAMDGFAVVAGPGGELEVAGESRAGAPATTTVEAGRAARISTGAVMPAGADAVVPVEWTEESRGRVRVPGTSPGANVRRAGEDMRAGDTLMRSGRTLGPPEIAVLASLGRESVRCTSRPRLAVVTTGDELTPPGEPLGPGRIHDSNGPGLAAQAVRAGADVVLRFRAPDEFEATRAALAEALDAADVLCVAGGVSVGAHDHVKRALLDLGVEQRFWGVRLKPGKPTWFGTAGRRLVFGLPGNPVSAMVTFHLFARPAIRALAGAEPEDRAATAILDAPVGRSPARDQAVRCKLTAGEDGWHALPTGSQGSHVLTSMLGADALAIVPAGEGEAAAGERIEIDIL